MQKARLFRVVAGLVASPGIIFVVALAIRIFVLIHLLPEQADNGFYRGNEATRIAWAMVSGFGFSSPWPNTPLAPTAQQPPVYPYCVSWDFQTCRGLLYLSLCIAVVFNAIFSSITAVLIFLLGKRVFGHRWDFAGWVCACWLHEAVVSIRLWESSLSALMLAASLYLLLHLLDSTALVPMVGVRSFGRCCSVNEYPLFYLSSFLGFGCGARDGYAVSLVLNKFSGAAAICLLVLLPGLFVTIQYSIAWSRCVTILGWSCGSATVRVSHTFLSTRQVFR